MKRIFGSVQSTPRLTARSKPSALNKEGYKVTVDGKMGKKTQAALAKFQKTNRLPARPIKPR
jgi:lysozyme family protein